MDAYTTYRYRFSRPVPIVVRYITCEIEKGMLVRYPDLYKRDKALADQLFRTEKVQVPAPTGK